MKQNLSDTWIRKALRTGEISAGSEVYDEKEPGLVFRVRKASQVWYQYAERGRVKSKLADWPAYGTDDARKLCSASKKRKAPVRPGDVPTLRKYYDDHYKPTFELTHKSDRSLASLSVLLGHFGNDRLDQITEEPVQRWRMMRRKSGTAAATVNRQVSALRALLRSAVPKYLETDQLAGLKPLRVEQEFRVRYLSVDEEKRLRDALDARERRIRDGRTNANLWRAERRYEPMEDLSNYLFADHLKPMVLVSLNTGLRQGELFSLEWRNVSDGFVRVTSAKAKSRRSRNVPLNREANWALDGWRDQSGEEGYVFKGRAEKVDNVRKAWGKVLADAEIQDFTWHDMRHHFASQLVMKGAPLNTVRELLGHADLSTTLRYAHLAPTHLREAVELLS